MDAHDLLAWHREHAERVVGAQIILGGKREFAEVVQAVQVVGMHVAGFEGAAVVADIVVGTAQR